MTSKQASPGLKSSLPPLSNEFKPLLVSTPINSSTDHIENTIPKNDTGTSEGLDIPEKVRSAKIRKLEKECVERLHEIAGLLALFSPNDAMVIIERSERLADKTAEVAENNAQFYAVVSKMVSAGPVMLLIAEIVGITSAIASNHDMNPVEKFVKKRLEKMNGKDNVSQFPGKV